MLFQLFAIAVIVLTSNVAFSDYADVWDGVGEITWANGGTHPCSPGSVQVNQTATELSIGPYKIDCGEWFASESKGTSAEIRGSELWTTSMLTGPLYLGTIAADKLEVEFETPTSDPDVTLYITARGTANSISYEEEIVWNNQLWGILTYDLLKRTAP